MSILKPIVRTVMSILAPIIVICIGAAVLSIGMTNSYDTMTTIGIVIVGAGLLWGLAVFYYYVVIDG